MVEEIKELQKTVNNLVILLERRKLEEEKIKSICLKEFEKNVEKICSYNTYELHTGYGIGMLKETLRNLLLVVKEQNKRINNLEKNIIL